MVFSYLRSLRRDGIAVLPARYPGRETRAAEQPIRDFGRLVAALAPVVAGLPPGPFALFGHSLGAYVAFTVAGELARLDFGQPEALFLASAPGPLGLGPGGVPLVAQASELSDDALLALLVGLGGIPPAMAAAPELSAMLADALRSDIEVFSSYRHQPRPPLDIPVSLFVGRDDPLVPQDQVNSWRECTTGVFEMHLVPGGHFFAGHSADQVRKLVGESCLRGIAAADK